MKYLQAILLILSYNEVTANRNMFSGGQEQFVGMDVSSLVFGVDDTDVFPVAYFDVNSDKLTDIVAVSRERTSINIFLAQNQPPYLKRAYRSDNLTERFKGRQLKIVSVRPGDFTGNGLADLMVTLGEDEKINGTVTPVDIVFCTVNLLDQKHLLMNLNCGGPGNGAILKGLTQEPSVLDLNGDMVLDLIGEMRTERETKLRMIWLSENTRESFEWIEKPFQVIGQWSNETIRDMIPVSSNAFADIDEDGIPELLIITKDPTAPKEKGVYYLESFEIVRDPQEQIAFQFKQPPELMDTGNRNETQVIGQPMIIDFQHTGTLQHLIPFCTDLHCKNTIGIYVMDQEKALPLPLGPLTYEGLRWSFIPPPTIHHKNNYHPNNGTKPFKMETLYSRALSLRVGDYNLDGFPDLLGVLRSDATGGQNRNTRAVLFENVPCVPAPESPCHYNRTFTANFNIFKDYRNVISASFYDISDNGALDVILVGMHKQMQTVQRQRFVIRAFENEMNFDASFLKVLVLTGQDCLQCDGSIPYGNVLPGATIRYSSINTKGVEESGIAVQTYRTSHMTLDLPCNVFGIGHSPNFIESLAVTAPNPEKVYKKVWKQIVPNSQIVVIPKPMERPNRWIMKLFLTPSDVVLKTFGILVAICFVLGTLAGGLEFKERREDRRARQSEAHRIVLWMS